MKLSQSVPVHEVILCGLPYSSNRGLPYVGLVYMWYTLVIADKYS